MAISIDRMGLLILDELAGRERRVLSLIVAVSRALNRSEAARGNLTETVKAALRKLVASGAIVDEHGMYSLSQPK